MKSRESNKIAILAHSFSNENYGALMVPFALQEIVKSLGYNPSIINLSFGEKPVKVFEDFRKMFLNLTKSYSVYSNWKSLNKLFDTFIVGSDQVWRNWWNNNTILFKFFFDFTNYNKKLIAYGASFGLSTFEADIETKQCIKNLLSSFEAISVREVSGVEICRNVFNVGALEVLDPTLLCDKKAYSRIIDSEEHTFPEKFITVMIFPEMYDTSEMKSFINDISHILGDLPIINIFEDGNYRSFSEWLYLLKNSTFTITDSFHGVCFSLIFERQFICFDNSSGGSDRFYSLLKKLNLLDHIFDTTRVLNSSKILNNPISYEDVNNEIDKNRKKSYEFIKEALGRDIHVNSKIYNEKRVKYFFRSLLNKKIIVRQIIKKILGK